MPKHEQQLLQALIAAGVADAEALMHEAIRRARIYRSRLANPKGKLKYTYLLQTNRYGRQLEQWLTAQGIPPLLIPPAPSKGLRHSLYIDPRRSTLVIYINGEPFNALQT